MNRVDTPQTRCRAGFARGDITPPVGIYHRMWGAAVHDRATAVHRPLLATLLWLEPIDDPRDDAQLIVALDHCILDGIEMAGIRAAVCRAVRLAPERVQVALSHTHGSGWMSRTRAHLPGGALIGPYLDGLAARLAELASEAAGRAERATIVYGQGRCVLAAHRDYRDARLNQFVCGFNPAGAADDTVVVGRIWAEKGETLGTMVNYACHPTTLAWDNTAISPDYVGATREVVEAHTGGPCLFLQGASGDLGPREGFVGDPGLADRNGRQLGYAALAAIEGLPAPGTCYGYRGPVVSGTLIGTWTHEPVEVEAQARQANWRCERRTVDLPYRHDLPTMTETQQQLTHWQAEEAKALDAQRQRQCRALVEQMTRQVARLGALPPGKTYPYPVAWWRIGEARWLFVPGELYQVFQTTLRQRFPDLPLVVVTHAGDWQPGYLPSASTYGYGIYQDVIAAVAPGALEVLIEAVTREFAADDYWSAHRPR